jgi:low temperature requirement protein LtrA
MKKINLTTAFLLLYLIVMAVLFRPKAPEKYTTYFLVLGGTLLIILLLRFIQIKRLKLQDKWKKED